MQRLMRIFLWRPRQPALARWLEAVALTAGALAMRHYLGPLRGANPGVIFIPSIVAATVLLGWPEALFVLVASIIVGWFLFLPPGMYLMPVAWLVIGGLLISAVAAFRATAQELAAADERQRMLFQVARRRIAKVSSAEFTVPEETKAALSPARAEAVRILEDAARRIAGGSGAHNRPHNAAMLQQELDAILRDAVATVVDERAVDLSVDVDALDLNFDLMSTITMLVLEIANESQKSAFRQGKGSRFSVALKALPDNRAALTIKDDGRAVGASGTMPAERSGGLEIVQALVTQMHGTLRTSFAGGAEFAIEFPLNR